ncbi:MAG: hypothetical protein ACPGJS_00480 [Flammeovirgaceae bacterium]
MKPLIYLCCIVLFASSCSFDQEIHFNKDWSGNAAFMVDLSTMMAMLPPDTTGGGLGGPTESLTKGFTEMEEEFSKTEGISNVEVEEDKELGKMQIKFDFASIDALNNCLQGEGDMGAVLSNKDHVFFRVKGKNKLIYEVPKMGESLKEEEPNMNLDQMAGMAAMMRYHLKLTFDRKVKKASSDNQYTKQTKSVEQDFGLDALMKEGFNGTIEVTLGK